MPAEPIEDLARRTLEGRCGTDRNVVPCDPHLNRPLLARTHTARGKLGTYPTLLASSLSIVEFNAERSRRPALVVVLVPLGHPSTDSIHPFQPPAGSRRVGTVVGRTGRPAPGPVFARWTFFLLYTVGVDHTHMPACFHVKERWKIFGRVLLDFFVFNSVWRLLATQQTTPQTNAAKLSQSNRRSLASVGGHPLSTLHSPRNTTRGL